ncbi:MAG: dienelactone hydrolase family protein [Gammaproteobacteria bacterium]
MCDDLTERDNQAHLDRTLSRREFNKLAAGVAMMATLPSNAGAVDVISQQVNVVTPDGVADCFFVHPATGKHPGVIIWPDIRGLRPAFEAMAKRLAESGYAVLCVNQFYRSTRAPFVKPGEQFSEPGVRARIIPFYQELNATTNVSDARAFATFLDSQNSVDASRKMGTMGYCMGGPIIMRTAAAIPDRIGAAASFHGGGLVTDKEDSPHLLIPKMKAKLLIAIAENDDEREPFSKYTLEEASKKHSIDAEIEVYADALHGWCPPDSAVYNEIQAEKAWSRLLALFDKALV